MSDDINWDVLKTATNGFSGDDLRRFAREVAFLHFNKFKVCYFFYFINSLFKFYFYFFLHFLVNPRKNCKVRIAKIRFNIFLNDGTIISRKPPFIVSLKKDY